MRARTRLIAVAAALAMHLAALAILLATIRGHAPESEPPPLLVTLTPWFRPRERAASPESLAINPHRTPPPALPAPPSPIPAPLPPPVALEPNSPISPRLAAQEALRGALQDTIRCAHPDQAGLTPAERDHCLRFNRQQGQGAPVYEVNADDHARHDPLVASHGTAIVNHLSPRPGTPLGSPPTGDHAWNQNPDERRGP